MDCVVITHEGNKQTNDLIERACRQRNIHYRPLDADTVDFSNLPRLSPGTLLYRVTLGSRYTALERHMLHQEVVTFYTDKTRLANDPYATLLHHEAGIPIPKTIFGVNRSHLDAYIEYVGGFPLIIKVIGGSHGIGVMRLDSRESLVSVLDHLDATKEYYIMRQCIQTRSSARLIVLGESVVDSIEYQTRSGDFRSNVGTPQVVPKKFSPELQRTAIRAVQTLGIETGGVDILFDDDGHYVAEVNFPCFFARSQHTTGTDIAGMMIDYLAKKSKQRYP
ncbi:MAG: ATP-grasp domain-containing protein [Patescibacteria group bacterium]